MSKLFRTSSLVVLILALLSLTGVAQQSPAAKTARTSSTQPTPTSAAPSSTDAGFAAPTSGSNQELTHAANEAASRTPQQAGVGGQGAKEPEDEEAAFKYSPAVRGISRVTGLSPDKAYWLCVIINFAIVAGLILIALKSNLPAMFRGRTEEIQKGIEEARRSSEDAGRRLRDVEARLSRLSAEIVEMQRHAEADAKAEEDRIRASIEEEKQKIVQAAEQEVAAAANVARRELQKYAVGLAIEMAEKGIRIDANEDKVLVEDFAEQLAIEARRNGSS